MKKTISFLLSVVFMLSVCAFNVQAEEEPSLIFDLSIGNDNGTAKVSDSEGNFDVAYTSNSNPMSYVEENEIIYGLYDKSGNTDTPTPSTGMVLTRNEAADLAMDGNITFEMWASVSLPRVVDNATRTATFFKMNQSGDSQVTGNNTYMSYLQVYPKSWGYTTSALQLVHRSGLKTSSGSLQKDTPNGSIIPEQNWVHIVSVRNVNGSQATQTLYVDGNKINALSFADMPFVSDVYDWDSDILSFDIGKLHDGSKIAATRIYNGAMTEQQVKQCYVAEAKLYQPAPESMEIENISPAENGILGSGGGRISISFNNYIDAQTAEGAQLTYSDGTAVSGGVYTLVDASGKSMEIIYGALEKDMELLLDLSAVSSENGYTPENAIIPFKSDDGYVYNQNFDGEDCIEGQPMPSTNRITIQNSDGVNPIVKTTVKGNQYGSVTAKLAGTSCYMRADITEALDNGSKLVVEGRFRHSTDASEGHADGTSRGIGTISDGTQNKSIATLEVAKNRLTVLNSQYNAFTTKDEDDFYNIRITYYKNNSGFIEAEVTELLNSTSYIVTTEMKTIQELTLLSMWSGSKDDIGRDVFDFDDLKLYYVLNPKVIYTNADGLKPQESAIELAVNNELDTGTVDEQTVTLADTNGNQLECAVRIDSNSDNHRICVEPRDYLEPNTTYTITLNGVLDTEGNSFNDTLEFTTSNSAVYAKSVDVQRNTTAVKVSVDIKNDTSDGADVYCIYVVYDEADEITGISVKNFSIEKNKSKQFVSDELSGGKYVKVFAMSCKNGINKPIFISSNIISIEQ